MMVMINIRDAARVDKLLRNLELSRDDYGVHKDLYDADPEVIEAMSVLSRKRKEYRDRQISCLKERRARLLVSAGSLALELKTPEYTLDILDKSNHAALARIGEIEFARLRKEKGLGK